MSARFNIEAVSSDGDTAFVECRLLGRTEFTVSDKSTLGGVHVTGYSQAPVLTKNQSPDLEVYRFTLRSARDAARFIPGQLGGGNI
jgi:hypothetical protein